MTFPPGRANEATRPLPIGSPATRHTIGMDALECGEAAFDLTSVARADRTQSHPQLRRRGLDRPQLPASGGYGVIPQHRHSCHAGREAQQQKRSVVVRTWIIRKPRWMRQPEAAAADR